MSDIEPVEIQANPTALFNALQYLDGEELDLLDEKGIHLAELGNNGLPNKLIVLLGWFQLRRKHPDLSYEDARRLIRVPLNSAAADVEAQPVDPTGAAASSI